MSPDEEENAVQQLGELIGYGRTMQLCEQLWRKSLKRDGWPVGGEHTTGPCATFMVVYSDGVACDWCCGAGRVTKKVFAVMTSQDLAKDSK